MCRGLIASALSRPADALIERRPLVALLESLMKTPFAAIHRGYSILIAALAVAGVAAAAAHAATSSDATPQAVAHHCGPGGHFMHVLKQLDLSPEQETQIKGVIAAATPEFQELRTSMRLNHEALAAAAPTDPGYPALLASEKANAAKRIDQMSALKMQIYALLTPAQLKQIPQIIAADRAKGQRRHRDSAAASPSGTTS
jgi:Spy/CpxP family protein refolding chaperone